MTLRCPAWLVSAPASGQGKTSVTAAIARAHRRMGRRVRVFKTGPDFLDPMILERASGHPVYQLDTWMGGDADVQRRLADAAASADLILVEGVMGLYDGQPSTADLASRFGLPVLAVVDGSAMAQTFGALVHGLATYRSDITVSAVLANRVGSPYHAQLLRESVRHDVRWLGHLARDARVALPERHLGLWSATEVHDLDARLDGLADALLQQGSHDLPDPVAFAAPEPITRAPPLHGCRLAVARDDAFAFIYPANLDLLRQAGAEIRFFSPVAGDGLPECDAVWLPGGYPELHLDALSANQRLRDALHAHVEAGKPLLAECGGLLYVLDELRDRDGHVASMAGLLPGRAAMQPRMAALGMQAVDLPEGTLRGHSFHYASAEIAQAPLAHATNPNGGPTREAVYRRGRITASFVHLYFPSHPEAVGRLFKP